MLHLVVARWCRELELVYIFVMGRANMHFTFGTMSENDWCLLTRSKAVQ